MIRAVEFPMMLFVSGPLRCRRSRCISVLCTAGWLLLACGTPESPESPAPAPSSPVADGPAWERLAPAAPVPADRPLNVGFLVVDGVYNSELVAPYDIFHHTVFHTEPGMEVFVVSPEGEAVTTFEGLKIDAHYGFDDAPPIDVLVVPSAEHSMDTDLENEALITWVQTTGRAARLRRFVV